MKKKNLYYTGILVIVTLLMVSCKHDHIPCDCRNGGVPTVRVFATGLKQPAWP